MLRWTLATILLVAAMVNAYLALSESVVWPIVPAVLWILVAAALITAEPKSEVPAPRAESEPVRRPVSV
ncbi:hypothetical protein [Alloactinosynnema sp. L-07]|uniref:hypothetical protein n=1 Tax=Alloactinosynnema sp. L-07 TaxID=1653480 RepID=UPI0006B61747|nr:hypothetical protein [Alloactinosynnema sp. L-07]